MSKDYKLEIESPNIAEQTSYQEDGDTKGSDQIEENLLQINSSVQLLIPSIKNEENESILTHLKQIYKFKDFFGFSAPVFNQDIFFFIFSNCINNNSPEIAKMALRILNNLLATKIKAFLDYTFSTSLPQIIINNLFSSDIGIKRKSFATICILSQSEPLKSLMFWDTIKSTICKEVSDVISSYIYNEILFFQQIQNFNSDNLLEIFDVIAFLVNESDNSKAKFDALKTISKGITELPYRKEFIQEYSNVNWLCFFVAMIHSNQLCKSKKCEYPILIEPVPTIEFGYSILKELVPFLEQDKIESENILDLELISMHIDYEIASDTFYQKYDIAIVKECLSFLCETISYHIPLIQKIIDNSENDDIMLKIFMIILQSVFDVREIASKILCIVLYNGSSSQITSLSLINIVESLFCILDFDPQSNDTVFKCFTRVIPAFLNKGYKINEFQELFLANNANDVFQSLIEYDRNTEENIRSICNLIDFLIDLNL